jgi:NAD(P)-dependent dehydrogenase (short-subunit alcohol dehydrogenase family)
MPLRAKLLEGRRVALAGGIEPEISDALAAQGAVLELLPVGELSSEEERVGEWGRAHAPLHAFVYSAAKRFGAGGEQALLSSLDEAWAAVREVAVGALLEPEHPAKVVLLGPRADAGPLAEAVRAGLENLARTLSVEWARYGVSVVAVTPGPRTTAMELRTLIAFLVSEAGEYLSGCRIELGSTA